MKDFEQISVAEIELEIEKRLRRARICMVIYLACSVVSVICGIIALCS